MPNGLDLDRPFTQADLTRHGLDPGLVRRTDVRRIFRGVWMHRDAIDADTRIRATVALHPEGGSIASHFSAGRLYALPLPDHRFEHVTVFRARDRRYRPEIKSHVTRRPRSITWVRGVPTTDPLTTFIQLAGMLGLVDLAVIGDHLVRTGLLSRSALVRGCSASKDHHARAASRAASYVREGVDSPMETRVRMLIVLAGLPEPTVNHVVRHADGTWRRRFDLWYPDARLIVEYDGRQHAEDAGQWLGDLDRREELDDEDLRILVVTARGVFVEPARTLERVRRNLIARGHGPVPPLNETWKQYFTS